MSLADMYRADREKPSGDPSFTCPYYDAPPGEKRCRHYLKNGACTRPDEFMCVEWMKANGHAVSPNAGPPADAPEPSEPPRAPGSKVATDLFGNPLPEPAQPPPSKTSPPKTTAPRRERPVEPAEVPDPPRGLTTEDIESFKTLRVEVCLRSDAFGEVWLVPEYTGRDRKEITPEHAATICQVLQAFPGSQVVTFEKSPKPEKETDA